MTDSGPGAGGVVFATPHKAEIPLAARRPMKIVSIASLPPQLAAMAPIVATPIKRAQSAVPPAQQPPPPESKAPIIAMPITAHSRATARPTIARSVARAGAQGGAIVPRAEVPASKPPAPAKPRGVRKEMPSVKPSEHMLQMLPLPKPREVAHAPGEFVVRLTLTVSASGGAPPGESLNDCGKCQFCADKPKFGGPGTKRQKCIMKRHVSSEARVWTSLGVCSSEHMRQLDEYASQPPPKELLEAAAKEPNGLKLVWGFRRARRARPLPPAYVVMYQCHKHVKFDRSFLHTSLEERHYARMGPARRMQLAGKMARGEGGGGRRGGRAHADWYSDGENSESDGDDSAAYDGSDGEEYASGRAGYPRQRSAQALQWHQPTGPSTFGAPPIAHARPINAADAAFIDAARRAAGGAVGAVPRADARALTAQESQALASGLVEWGGHARPSGVVRSAAHRRASRPTAPVLATVVSPSRAFAPSDCLVEPAAADDIDEPPPMRVTLRVTPETDDNSRSARAKRGGAAIAPTRRRKRKEPTSASAAEKPNAEPSADPAEAPKRRRGSLSLRSCRRCGVECIKSELQLGMCGECALEHVLGGMPVSERQMIGTAAALARFEEEEAEAAAREAEEAADAARRPAKRRREPAAAATRPSPKGRGAKPRKRRAAGVVAAPIGDSDSGGEEANVESAMGPARRKYAALRKEIEARGLHYNLERAEAEPAAPNSVWIWSEAASILRQLRCAICLGYVDRAVTAPCMHRFCQGCIEKWLRLGRHDCPECKHPCATRRAFRRDGRIDELVAASLSEFGLDPSGMEAEQLDAERVEEVEAILLHQEEAPKARGARSKALLLCDAG